MKTIKRILVRVFVPIAVAFSVGGSCSKSGGSGGGGGGGGTTEANLVVTLNPPANSTQPASPGTDFPLTVTITSTMPPQGVTIDVVAKKDGSADPAYFTVSGQSSSTSVNNFTITNTPAGVQCLVTVTVTSKSKPTNTWTGSYRYSKKP